MNPCFRLKHVKPYSSTEDISSQHDRPYSSKYCLAPSAGQSKIKSYLIFTIQQVDLEITWFFIFEAN
jgi:hypothetical protein